MQFRSIVHDKVSTCFWWTLHASEHCSSEGAWKFALTFKEKHDLTATPEDVRRIRAQLTSLYSAIETIKRPTGGYVQLYHGDAIRAEIASRSDLWGGFGAALAMTEMPAHWSTKYRASVAYHLASLLADVVNS